MGFNRRMMISRFRHWYCVFLTLFVGRNTLQVVDAQSLLSNLLACPNATSSNGEGECFLGSFGFIMHRGTGSQCQQKCILLPPMATAFGWKCGLCDILIASPVSPPVLTPLNVPIRAPVAPVFTPLNSPKGSPVAPTSSASFKCGGAVNTGGGSANATCTKDLWNPTQNKNMHCYAYGGVTDPCALHNNNDANGGLFKNPINCDRDTFYLWDEPDTQGKSYTWAGQEWLSYSNRYASEIQTLRRRGVRFTSPLLKAGAPGVTGSNLNAFYAACGSQCRNQSSPSYINVNAVNVFIGPWNVDGIQGCRDGANYMVNEIKAYDADNLPWYITNWSRLGTYNVSDQVDAMKVIQLFFQSGSPVERIYWFGATDYGGNSGNNFLTQVTPSGKRLGQVWQEQCAVL